MKINRIFVLITALFLSVTMLAACAKPLEEMNAQELIDLGEKYLLEMDYEKATVYFDRLIEVEPMNARAYTGLAEVNIAQKDVDKAIDVLQKGLKSLPDDSAIKDMHDKLISEKFEIAQGLFDKQDYEKAIEQFMKLVGLVPLDARGYIGCAESYIAQKDADKAIDILKQGLEKLPDDAKIKELLNKLLEQKEREEFEIKANKTLTQLAKECSSKNYEAVFEKMNTKDFAAIKKLSKDSPYIVQTEHGKIGIYKTKEDYMIYFGGYTGDTRSGSGIWLGIDEGSKYLAECGRKSDKPNGAATESTWEDDHSIIQKGDVVNGLWNGTVSVTLSEGKFNVEMDRGYPVKIRDFKENTDGEMRYVVSERSNSLWTVDGEYLKILVMLLLSMTAQVLTLMRLLVQIRQVLKLIVTQSCLMVTVSLQNWCVIMIQN